MPQFIILVYPQLVGGPYQLPASRKSGFQWTLAENGGQDQYSIGTVGYKSPRFSVERLQVRIDRGTPPHRFVVAYLRGTRRVCRFDRHPETPKPGTLFLEMLGAPTRKAADEWTLYEPEEWADSNLDSSTHCELDMGLPTHTNLLILAACYALATDTKVCNYELFRYNCYFFSWTITMIVARHTLPLVPPSPERVVQSTNLPAEIGHIAGSVAERTTTGLIEMVLDTITAVRTTTDKALNPGLGKRELLVWGLPTNIFCFLLRSGLKLQLRAGLETRLRARVRAQLEQSAKQVPYNPRKWNGFVIELT